MDAFEQLSRATLTAHAENDLPDFLAKRIFRIIEHADRYRGHAAAVADLAFQVEQYDTYAQTGYMGMGVNNAVLEASIRRLEGYGGTDCMAA